MAAGLGTRMRPLTSKVPKPLIKVHNIPMIETVIKALENANVSKIYVVTGYLSEKFNYLTKKYPSITLVYNPDYQTVNNISSIYYAKDVLLQGDCFICETDLYISDLNIFKANLKHSCYFGKMVKGLSNDWVFDLDAKGYITRVGRAGNNKYNMVGLTYFTKSGAKILANAINDAYKVAGYEQLFYDDVVNKHLDQLKLKIHPVTLDQVVEIDTVEELNKVNSEV